MRTVLFFFWMWIVLLFSIVLLIPLFLMNLFKAYRIRKIYIQKVTSLWAGHLIFTSGSKIEVKGIENIPSDRSFCIVCNHQSNFDIPLLLSIMPVHLGFIGKDEMRKIPFLNTWMKSLNCVFIKRNNIRHSMNGLLKAMENVKRGQSMVLFPEGTRSRDGLPGKFHSAGLKLAIEKNIVLLPVSITNSHFMFEKNNRITPVKVKIVIHKARLFEPDEMKTGPIEIIEIIKKELEIGGKND